jgi:excinuclease ABC subunit C
MSSLFSASSFRDFGTLSLAPAHDVPPLVHIEGVRSSQLRQQLALLAPRRPGVYGMIDATGLLHYVGKAKNLRSRLLSYFSKSRPAKATRLLRLTKAIVWEVWPREFSALLRELELIRRWRPRSNVVGQPLPRRHGFLCLGRPPAPHLFLTRQVPSTAVASFGPLPLSARTELAARLLNDLFRLRECPQAMEMVFAEQAELFPLDRPVGCLRLDLGTCLAPCAGACSRGAYFAEVRRAKSFLDGDHEPTLGRLRAAMADAARKQEFERAAALRDKVQALDWLNMRLKRLRDARQELSLVYPVEGPGRCTWWYVLHAGRPLLAAPAPRTGAEAEAFLDTLDRIYRRNDDPRLADSYEHIDGMLLVSAWFRKFPRERRRALTPEQAMKNCRALL